MNKLAPTIDIKEPKNLPEPIKAWLASIQLTLMIIELNQRLGFTGKKQTVVPRLMWKLTIGEISPRDLAKELSLRLDIAPSAAASLAKEVEEKFFRPIELPLRTELGVDTKLVYFTPPSPAVASREGGLPPPPSVAKAMEGGPSAKESRPVTPPLIQTKEAAHPSFAKASEGKPQERQVPTPPPVPPRPSEPIIKAESAPEVKVPISVKKSKVAWGEGRQT